MLLPRRMNARNMYGSRRETISGARASDPGRRYANVCVEQLARPSVHLASNLLIHRTRNANWLSETPNTEALVSTE